MTYPVFPAATVPLTVPVLVADPMVPGGGTRNESSVDNSWSAVTSTEICAVSAVVEAAACA